MRLMMEGVMNTRTLDPSLSAILLLVGLAALVHTHRVQAESKNSP